MADIKTGRIRLIGNPKERYIEDPVRMLRAIRFAVKLGFRIDPESEKPILKLGDRLKEMPPARLFDECVKLFTGGVALQTFEQLRHYDLFRILFPQTDELLSEQEGGFPHFLLIQALKNTDLRIAEDKPVTPGFLVAALLWVPMINLVREYERRGLSEVEAITLASDVVISKQVNRTAMPRRYSQMAREVWQLQTRLRNTRGSRPARLMKHPRFRAAYDFLLLRAEVEGEEQQLATWWTDYILEGSSESVDPSKRKRRRRRRGSRNRPIKNKQP